MLGLVAPVLLLAACANLGSADLAVDREACPRGAEPDYEVVVQVGPAARDDTVTVAQLTGMGHHRFGQTALGSTSGSLGVTTKVLSLSAPARSEGVCVYPTRLVFTLALVGRVVHVAREFDQEACLHDEVLAHEMRHVALDNEILGSARPMLMSALPAQLEAVLGVWGADNPTAFANLSKRLTEIEIRLRDQVQAVRSQRHAQEIDTKGESQRASSMCGGRLKQLHITKS